MFGKTMSGMVGAVALAVGAGSFTATVARADDFSFGFSYGPRYVSPAPVVMAVPSYGNYAPYYGGCGNTYAGYGYSYPEYAATVYSPSTYYAPAPAVYGSPGYYGASVYVASRPVVYPRPACATRPPYYYPRPVYGPRPVHHNPRPTPYARPYYGSNAGRGPGYGHHGNYRPYGGGGARVRARR